MTDRIKVFIDTAPLIYFFEGNSDYFITNDKELKKYTEIKILLIDEYKTIINNLSHT